MVTINLVENDIKLKQFIINGFTFSIGTLDKVKLNYISKGVQISFKKPYLIPRKKNNFLKNRSNINGTVIENYICGWLFLYYFKIVIRSD